MNIKAALVVRLLANDVIVAESEDPTLWHRVLATVNVVEQASGLTSVRTGIAGAEVSHNDPLSGPAAVWAAELGVSESDLESSCGPRREEPFLRLNPRCWEAFKKNVTDRGPGAIAPIALAATLLSQWFRIAGIPGPTVPEAQAVLKTIALRDANAHRGIARCKWLLNRSEGIAVDPSRVSVANQVSAAFVQRRRMTSIEE
jgi:hypothetical protein